MNFKLTNLSAINQKYGKTMEQLKGSIWEAPFLFVGDSAMQRVKSATRFLFVFAKKASPFQITGGTRQLYHLAVPP